MTTTTDTEELRTEFEDWAIGQPSLMALDNAWGRCPSTGEYEHQEMEVAWEAYQAGRAALSGDSNG